MPRRISRLGGTTLRRSFMTNAYSPGILERGRRRLGIPADTLRPPLDSPLSGDARLQEAAVLRHHAAILDHVDSGPRELLGGRGVRDTELEPDRRRPPGQGQDLVGVARKVLGMPKNLDHVGRLGEIFQPGHGQRAMERTAGELRIDGLDAIAARYEVSR